MPSLDHDAIRRAYPNAVTIDDGFGAFDASDNSITLEQSKIDAARSELNAENAAVQYRDDRVGPPISRQTDTIYPSFGDQLDLLYKDILAGKLDSTGEFAKAIKATKDKYPKPS